MITKIDVQSPEFSAEKKRTISFVETVHEKRGWVYHPDEKINESVIVGLTRNQLIYGTRYCPCFMVEGETKEERREKNNRICPCKPALQDEIPNEGRCHCGIYCTPELAEKVRLEDEAEVVAHTHSRGLSQEECQALLGEKNIDSDDLDALLEARKIGFVDFNLVDVREWNEWVEGRIIGTDNLIPTTSFYETVNQLNDQKDKPTIVYCFSGSRSRYCQRVMGDLGFTQVINLKRGIMAWHGKTDSGE
jgi:ferredoxin-thioredoxin reductase catalytic subunit/rhodanese-related sulfurtransferase